MDWREDLIARMSMLAAWVAGLAHLAAEKSMRASRVATYEAVDGLRKLSFWQALALPMVLVTIQRRVWRRLVGLREKSKRAIMLSSQAMKAFEAPTDALEGKTITCKGAVCFGKKELSIENVQVLPPENGQVRIKMACVAISPHDVLAYSGQDSRFPCSYPCVLGLQGSGVVESVGPGVESVKRGDHVVVCPTPHCGGKCPGCRSNKGNRCSFADDRCQGGVVLGNQATSFHFLGKQVSHFGGCSTFCEYTVCQEEHVARVDPKAALDRVCLLSDSVPCGLGSVLNGVPSPCQDKVGATALVVGCGATGLACIEALCKSKASRIIAADDCDERLSDARRTWGATDTINLSKASTHRAALSQTIQEMTGGAGVDYAYDSTGNVFFMSQALESCSPGWGELTLTQPISSAGQQLSFPPGQIAQGRVLRGSIFGGFKGRRDVPDLVQAYLEGGVKLDRYVSHTLPFEQLEHALEMERQGKSLGIVLFFSRLQ